MKRPTKIGLAVTALAVSVIAVFALFSSVSVEAAYPAAHAKRTFATKVLTRIRGAFAGAAAAAENRRLKLELESLAMLREDMERLEADNARLRAALGYAQRTPSEWIACGVISDGGAMAVRRFLRLDKGSLNGICEGAVVTVPEGLVGRVESVTPHTAVVTPISEASVKVHCEVETTEAVKLRGVLYGGSDMLILRHLTGAKEAPPRSRVITSGLGGVFPRGLPVGFFVGFSDSSANSPTREAVIEPCVDFTAIEDVFVRREK